MIVLTKEQEDRYEYWKEYIEKHPYAEDDDYD